MAAADRVHEIIAPLVEAAGLDLYDLELAGGVLRVLVDREGGADIDAIRKLTRATSSALDEPDTIARRSPLKVSTPGLEPPLRTPPQYPGAMGTPLTVKPPTPQ